MEAHAMEFYASSLLLLCIADVCADHRGRGYCLKHKILTLYMPRHSSHILQQLDVVCFSPLKRKHS
jgi:hypothetical protein